jgi:nicotinate-nucleotide adenylyltransferase
MAGSRRRADPPLNQRIGLLGGSFNPAHGGHRRISLFALKALGLSELWWLVSPGNPLKPREGMAPLRARFASAQDQARRAPIRVTAIERDLGTRYTLDTLAHLQRRYPRHRFVWIMGADNLAQFHQWHRWRDIARIMPIAVIARPGYDAQARRSPAYAALRRRLTLLRFDPDPRSATQIRARAPDWAAQTGHRPLRDHLTTRPI